MLAHGAPFAIGALAGAFSEKFDAKYGAFVALSAEISALSVLGFLMGMTLCTGGDERAKRNTSYCRWCADYNHNGRYSSGIFLLEVSRSF